VLIIFTGACIIIKQLENIGLYSVKRIIISFLFRELTPVLANEAAVDFELNYELDKYG